MASGPSTRRLYDESEPAALDRSGVGRLGSSHFGTTSLAADAAASSDAAVRAAVRSDPVVIREIDAFYKLVEKDANGDVTREGYLDLLLRAHRALVPSGSAPLPGRFGVNKALGVDLSSTQDDLAREACAEDWARDAGPSGTMGYVRFADAVFELADLWVPAAGDAHAHAEFLGGLRRRLVVRRIHKPDGTVVRQLPVVSVVEVLPRLVLDDEGGEDGASRPGTPGGGGMTEDQAAVKVQASIRRRQVTAKVEAQREKKKEDAVQAGAATRMQALYRGRAGKKRVAEVRVLHSEQAEAAVRIQNIQRQKLARRKVDAKKGAIAAEAQRKADLRAAREAAGPLDEDAAAAKMQTLYRGKQARRRVDEKRGENKAATLIQGKQRQKLAAKRVEARRQEKIEEEAAAARVQASYRGRLGRARVERMGQEKAAVKMQAVQRRRAAKQRVEDLKAERKEAADQQKAAVLIQNKQRQKTARAKVDARRERMDAARKEAIENTELNELAQFPDGEDAGGADEAAGDVVEWAWAELDEVKAAGAVLANFERGEYERKGEADARKVADAWRLHTPKATPPGADNPRRGLKQLLLERYVRYPGHRRRCMTGTPLTIAVCGSPTASRTRCAACSRAKAARWRPRPGARGAAAPAAATATTTARPRRSPRSSTARPRGSWPPSRASWPRKGCSRPRSTPCCRSSSRRATRSWWPPTPRSRSTATSTSSWTRSRRSRRRRSCW